MAFDTLSVWLGDTVIFYYQLTETWRNGPTGIAPQREPDFFNVLEFENIDVQHIHQTHYKTDTGEYTNHF